MITETALFYFYYGVDNMELNIGENIRRLRRERDMTQEQLSELLGVTCAAVSKWERCESCPDIGMVIPLARVFGVSTDELFDYNRIENERKVKEICDEAYKYRYSDPKKSEKILRDGLKKFPGNDIILLSLLYVIESDEETIDVCKTLIEITRDDATKYSAYLFMAHSYKSLGQYALVKESVEKIPEMYFTKLSVAAEYYEGEDAFEAACKSLSMSFEHLLWASRALSKYYVGRGDVEKARKQLEMALKVIEAVLDNDGTEYVKDLYKTYTGYLVDLDNDAANL